MADFLRKLREKAIHLCLLLVLFLLGLYLFDGCFRNLLQALKIDPNFIIGFFTVIAVLLSLIQASHDKRYAYNLNLIASIEEKGLRIIGKLLGIRQKSSAMLTTLQQVKICMGKNVIYHDPNNTTDKADVEADMELVTAYINTYYPELSDRWNDVLTDLGTIGTHNGTVLLNYNGNIELIRMGTKFKNDALDGLDASIVDAERLDKKIDAMTLDMRNDITKKINDSKEKVKTASISSSNPELLIMSAIQRIEELEQESGA